MEIHKKDTQKVKTNPRYKCVDQVSDEEGLDDHAHAKNEDLQALSEKEFDFRETIIKADRKKQKRERRHKERELKKLKALNGEDGNTGIASTGEAGTAGGELSHDDEEEEEESHSKSDVSSSDTDSKDGGHGKNGDKKLKKEQKQNEGTDGVSSVTSRQNRTERNHYLLRLAIDEQFVPKSIKNIRLSAYFVFCILLALAGKYSYLIVINFSDILCA